MNIANRSKKVKSIHLNSETITHESLMEYLYELKQKVDYLYHICAIVGQKNENIKEETDESEEEELKGGRILPTFPNNPTFNFMPSSKRKEEIQLQFESSDFSSRTQTNNAYYNLLMSKKNFQKQKQTENESKTKMNRNANLPKFPWSTTNNNPGPNNSNPFFSFQNNAQRSDLGDVNMFS
jgi:hypothetical protein